MRSYRQRCGLAQALDVVGDRWMLLIVRELLIRGPSRYTDLKNGLPGIATNQLAERLRELEAAVVIAREEAPPPVATTLFQLTQWGRELEPAILLLGQWAAPLLADTPKDHAFMAHWMVLPLKLRLVDRAPAKRPVSVELRTEEQRITVEVASGAINVYLGAARNPDATVKGDAWKVFAFMCGKVGVTAADVQISGDASVVHRLIPVSAAA